jgi:DNA-binding CsgD family transcriptional regulator
MGRVSESDLRAIFRFLGSATIGSPQDPLPRPTLAALRDLLDADEAEYFELRRSDRAVLAAATSHDISSAPGTDEALSEFGHQNPLNWRRWHPAHGALRLSGMVRRREFERLGFHGAFMRPNGLRDVLKVWLWSSDASAACVQLWRREADFGRREQDVLAVLHHQLIALRARARDRDPATAGLVALTVREAEVLTWAARGASDARIAARLGLSPATVGKHLEHAYAALGVHSRAEAVGRVTLTGVDGPSED